jgi:hypothetical protein
MEGQGVDTFTVLADYWRPTVIAWSGEGRADLLLP